jgi:mono/diheme cytochrome c family protein
MLRTILLVVWVAGVQIAFGQQQKGVSGSPAASRHQFLNQYCIACHNERLKTGGLVLDKLDVEHVEGASEVWEKVVRKLRAGMMPPSGMPRPDRAELNRFATSLETALDSAAAARPDPGTAALHRLNRTEYANSIRDLLALDVDTTTLLPPDDASDGFDNIADVLGVSPALLERYLASAAKISRAAVGDMSIAPLTATYRVRGDLSQNEHIEGLPLGTRGGMLVKHNFPLDAEYSFKFSLLRTSVGAVFGQAARDEKLELTVDGARGGLLDLAASLNRAGRGGAGNRPTGQNAGASGQAPAPGPGNAPPARPQESLELRVKLAAGPHSVGVSFLTKDAALVEDLWQPSIRSTSDVNTGQQTGYTTLPHLAGVAITGPFNPTGAGDTPSRRKIFLCRPASANQETTCAKKIIATLARRAYRRPVNETDLEPLLSFYQQGRNKGSFDSGIELALRRILADPQFVFRIERDPEQAKPGSVHSVSDLELASRLSFFLWSSIPDDELLDLAVRGQLHNPEVLQQQTKRMLADARSDALVNNFAEQWLSLRDLKNATPQSRDFDDNLRESMRKETELFFGSIIREDRSVLDLLQADYTFVDERLARHYGIPNVYGSRFRRVTLPDETRRGILGEASILTTTSVANRTSPVARGKWILENLLGTPPPLPPPNVPSLPEKSGQEQPKSVRAQMEAHRANPVCAACHKIMDPIGFSLENFDLTGKWRATDGGSPINATGQLVDGTKIDGVISFRKALLTYSDQFARTLVEKLLTYGSGRAVQYYDEPVVREITRRAAKANYRFSSIIAGIVSSPPFLMRKNEPGAPPVQHAGLNRNSPALNKEN